MTVVYFKKLTESAKIPKFAHFSDACFDFFCIDGGVIGPKKSKVFHTGLAMEIGQPYTDNRFFMRLYPRSGLAFNHDIICHIGTIDEDYRGEIAVKLFNLGDEPYEVLPGERICQGQIEVKREAYIKEVDSLDTMHTERGKRGFGSSGRW